MLDPGCGDPREQVGQEGQARRRQHRLRRRQRQRPQPSPFAADQNDCVNLLYHQRRPSENFATINRDRTPTGPKAPAQRSDAQGPSAGRRGRCRCLCDALPDCATTLARSRDLVVQHFRRRHVDVEPAGPPHPVAEVDVLHVHEVAPVEPADLLEGWRDGTSRHDPESQPTGRSLGSQQFLPIGRRPGSSSTADRGQRAFHPG